MNKKKNNHHDSSNKNFLKKPRSYPEEIKRLYCSVMKKGLAKTTPERNEKFSQSEVLKNAIEKGYVESAESFNSKALLKNLYAISSEDETVFLSYNIEEVTVNSEGKQKKKNNEEKEKVMLLGDLITSVKGNARRAMEEMKIIAKDLGCAKIIVDIDKTNTGSKKMFTEKLKFIKDENANTKENEDKYYFNL